MRTNLIKFIYCICISMIGGSALAQELVQCGSLFAQEFLESIQEYRRMEQEVAELPSGSEKLQLLAELRKKRKELTEQFGKAVFERPREPEIVEIVRIENVEAPTDTGPATARSQTLLVPNFKFNFLLSFDAHEPYRVGSQYRLDFAGVMWSRDENTIVIRSSGAGSRAFDLKTAKEIPQPNDFNDGILSRDGKAWARTVFVGGKALTEVRDLRTGAILLPETEGHAVHESPESFQGETIVLANGSIGINETFTELDTRRRLKRSLDPELFRHGLRVTSVFDIKQTKDGFVINDLVLNRPPITIPGPATYVPLDQHRKLMFTTNSSSILVDGDSWTVRHFDRYTRISPSGKWLTRVDKTQSSAPDLTAFNYETGQTFQLSNLGDLPPRRELGNYLGQQDLLFLNSGSSIYIIDYHSEFKSVIEMIPRPRLIGVSPSGRKLILDEGNHDSLEVIEFVRGQPPKTSRMPSQMPPVPRRKF